MAKKESQLVAARPEEQLLSKQAIQLPPKERLQLLLSANYYPVVKKRTSAVAQIKEMINFYDFCAIMLTKFFPDEKAEANYIALALIDSKQGQFGTNQLMNRRLSEAFELVKNYEEFERKITAIQNLFWQYSKDFPDLFEKYNLEDLATQSIFDVLDGARYMLENHAPEAKKLMDHWGVL